MVLTKEDYIALGKTLKLNKFNDLEKNMVEDFILTYKSELIKHKKQLFYTEDMIPIQLHPTLDFIKNISLKSNVLFYGQPNTHKTKLMLMIAEHLSSLGYIVTYVSSNGDVTSDLTSQFNVKDVIFLLGAEVSTVIRYALDIDVLIYDDISFMQNSASFKTLMNLKLLTIFVDQVRIANLHNNSNIEWYRYRPSNSYANLLSHNKYQLMRYENDQIAIRNMIDGDINIIKSP